MPSCTTHEDFKETDPGLILRHFYTKHTPDEWHEICKTLSKDDIEILIDTFRNLDALDKAVNLLIFRGSLK